MGHHNDAHLCNSILLRLGDLFHEWFRDRYFVFLQNSSCSVQSLGPLPQRSFGPQFLSCFCAVHNLVHLFLSTCCIGTCKDNKLLAGHRRNPLTKAACPSTIGWVCTCWTVEASAYIAVEIDKADKEGSVEDRLRFCPQPYINDIQYIRSEGRCRTTICWIERATKGHNTCYRTRPIVHIDNTYINYHDEAAMQSEVHVTQQSLTLNLVLNLPGRRVQNVDGGARGGPLPLSISIVLVDIPIKQIFEHPFTGHDIVTQIRINAATRSAAEPLEKRFLSDQIL